MIRYRWSDSSSECGVRRQESKKSSDVDRGRRASDARWRGNVGGMDRIDVDAEGAAASKDAVDAAIGASAAAVIKDAVADRPEGAAAVS